VASVLKYYQHHPNHILFGVTGDVDNLGIYVARNGRSKAEILVDTYNRIMGSVFYKFIESRPQEFFEVCFLPAGEEIFILGVASNLQAAESLFACLRSTDVVTILSENLSIDIGGTNITFGCSSFENNFMFSQIEKLLVAIENSDTEIANVFYIEIINEIRQRLSIELDRHKFSSLGIDGGDEILMRNLVYLKTIQYKEETKQLLKSAQKKFNESFEAKSIISSILGKEYGLQNIDAKSVLSKVSGLLVSEKK